MNILCATDFSQTAMAASDIAAGLAKQLRLPLRLVHAAQDYSAGAALLGSTVQAVLARAHKPVFVVTPHLV